MHLHAGAGIHASPSKSPSSFLKDFALIFLISTVKN